MPHPRFDALREKLLRAGVAPRHVRRYLGELRQHHADLLAEEAANGVRGDAAEQAARTRLGSNDDLAAAMLAKPELRSVSARFPWAIFGIAPLLVLAIALFAAELFQVGVMKLHLALTHDAGTHVPGWMKAFVAACDFAMMYVFPVAVVAAFCLAGIRQRMAPTWIVLGALVTSFAGALVTSTAVWSTIPHQSALSVGFGASSETLPPRLYPAIALVVVLLALQWWLTRPRPMAE